MTYKTTWRREPNKYVQPLVYMVGKIRVGSVVWNSLRSKTDVDCNYTYHIDLPTLKKPSGTAPTEDIAKDMVEQNVKIWLDGLKAETGA